MKTMQHRVETPQPRRMPSPEVMTDLAEKGRKHEAFEGGGSGRSLARAVGQALGANPFAPVVPCHRILAAHGASGGFSANGGARTKLRMLESEGAVLGDGDNLPLFG